MLELSALLNRLNAEIDSYNRELSESVETGDVREDAAESMRVAAGSATPELVRKDKWPESFAHAVESVVTTVWPKEVVTLAKSVKEPTEHTKWIQHAAASASGTHEALVNTLQLAHLLARTS